MRPLLLSLAALTGLMVTMAPAKIGNYNVVKGPDGRDRLVLNEKANRARLPKNKQIAKRKSAAKKVKVGKGVLVIPAKKRGE